MDTLTKLGILAEAARFDVACTSSGVDRGPRAGRLGATQAAGCCHSFTADGRCITLLKVLMSNACSYDCAYCVNRRQESCQRASFSPRELAELTVDFYRRNYVEGLFLSSGVLGTPDATCERMIECLRILRDELRFNGYVHAKVIPGTAPELIDALGRLADRLSVNLELPSAASLGSLCPDKDAQGVLRPMAQIRATRDDEALRLLAEGRGREGRRLGGTAAAPVGTGLGRAGDTGAAAPGGLATAAGGEAGRLAGDVAGSVGAASAASGAHGPVPTSGAGAGDGAGCSAGMAGAGRAGGPAGAVGLAAAGARRLSPAVAWSLDADEPLPVRTNGNELTVRRRSAVSATRRRFAPAGQSTQLIVGATGEDDNHILQLSSALYRKFDLKRVFFSAYLPMVEDERLPGAGTPAPLRREHRLYQADWLMRYYAFSADELARPDAPWLDLEIDPKLAWALANIERFPVEVMDAPLETLLRVPGIGPVGARRIVAARLAGPIGFDDLARLRVTLRRARHFLTCNGKRDKGCPLDAQTIRERVVSDARTSAYNRARRQAEGQLALF